MERAERIKKKFWQKKENVFENKQHAGRPHYNKQTFVGNWNE